MTQIRRGATDLQVSLPADLAELVAERAASGRNADSSDVVREGLRALQAHDAHLDHWLKQDVLPAYDAFVADPNRGSSADEVWTRLELRSTRPEHDSGR